MRRFFSSDGFADLSNYRRFLAEQFGGLVVFNTDPNNPGGGGGSGDDDKEKRDREWRERRGKDLEGMAAEAMKARILDLEVQKHELNNQVKATKEQLKSLEAERKELEAYRAYGKPEELKTKLEQAAKDAETVVGYKRLELVGEAAKLTDLEFEVGGKKELRKVNAEKLGELVKLKGLDLEIGETQVMKDGKLEKAKAAFVKVPEEGGKSKSVALPEYVRANLSNFADWLADTTPAPAGTKAVGQNGGTGKAPQTSAGQSLVSRMYGAPKKE